jgi:hypothetical protein
MEILSPWVIDSPETTYKSLKRCIVLSCEEDLGDQGYFTRERQKYEYPEGTEVINDFWGHYNMSYMEALSDSQERYARLLMVRIESMG